MNNEVLKQTRELLKERRAEVQNNESGGVVVGKVSSEPVFSYRSEKKREDFYIVSLDTKRNSKTVDTLIVMISDHIIAKNDLEDLEGKTVIISGELRSRYNNKSLEVYVAAETIDIVDDGFHHYNNFHLTAQLHTDPTLRKTVAQNKRICDMFVKRHVSKYNYFLPCILWNRNSLYASRLKKGDTVYISGRLQSRCFIKKTDEGSVRRVIHELSVAVIEAVDEHDGESIEETPENVITEEIPVQKDEVEEISSNDNDEQLAE